MTLRPHLLDRSKNDKINPICLMNLCCYWLMVTVTIWVRMRG